MGGLGGDNMSIIIICMLHGKPWESLVEKCKRYHSERKATSKLCEPAFSAFDRLTSDGPFAEVSVLKAASDELTNANETSSSSHTSSPSSSSPISTEEKFEIPEASPQQNASSATASTQDGVNAEVSPKKDEILPNSNDKSDDNEAEKMVQVVESVKTSNDEILESTSSADSSATVVSNGD